MKKKFFAVLSIVLIVVLACSMAACSSKTMFDGKFTKEASAEDAKSMWDGASASMGGDSNSLLATASSNSAQAVKGWDGIKMSASLKMDTSSVYKEETAKMTVDFKTNGAYLFDEGAMAITGTSKTTNVYKGETDDINVNAGIYAKDGKSYINIGVGENNLKVILSDTPSFGDGGIFQLSTVIASLSTQFAAMATSTISNFLCEASYDEMVEEYGKDFKAYVNDSGDYTRIKYTFASEMILDLTDYIPTDYYDEFVKSATFGECSIILVADKETKTFQGAKLQINFAFDFKDEANETSFSIKYNTTASIENCNKVDSLPSNFDDYKEMKNISPEDITKFLEGLPY